LAPLFFFSQGAAPEPFLEALLENYSTGFGKSQSATRLATRALESSIVIVTTDLSFHETMAAHDTLKNNPGPCVEACYSIFTTGCGGHLACRVQDVRAVSGTRQYRGARQHFAF
jgi:hypothetical protein